MVGFFFNSKFFHLLEIILLLLNLSFPISISSISKQYEQQQPSINYSYCGNIKLQKPFHHQNLNHFSSILNQLLLCKSQKLYFRTSIGLFQISSIDYSRKLLTITNPSHSNYSSISHNFISSKLLTSGFPPPPQPNSLVFFNCSSLINSSSLPFLHIKNCPNYFNNNGYGASPSSVCLVVEEYDDGKHQELLDDMKEIMNHCTHYTRTHRTSEGRFEIGTRMSFDIPNHVPNPCDECRKPNGNCGVGLRCICHLNDCSKYFFFILVITYYHFLVLNFYYDHFFFQKIR